MTENWRAIPGYEGFYEVSDQGRIKSLARPVNRGLGRVGRSRTIIVKQRTNRCGYAYVSLSKFGQAKVFTVHKLVGLAFFGVPGEGQEMRHLNGVRVDNRVSNLVWGSKSENERDKLVHGTNIFVNRTHCPLGHILAAPNLREYHASAFNHRSCLACSRARARLRIPKNAHWDLKATADWYYEKIMSGKPSIECCPRGHLLAAPNLVASGMRAGRRQCLACNRVGVRLGGVGHPDMQRLSDAEYRRITEATAA
ncbi:NUMOD4 domain-containing protein [Nocardia otitidiscaviarum]|uniref:NUMOD4 domain-containing protein n=1 Tax=Nocardia otitidiscaviarum TaxID=1823 RepID=UPI0009DEB7EE|nr:NUMOD4 domain-containing protein [Nocardia otitidiscaviarum]